MRKSISILLCTLFGTTVSLAAAAHGGGGGGGFNHGTPEGPSSSASSFENSNGRFSQDRDQGMGRAEDRMNTSAAAHSKSTDTHGKTRHHARSHRSSDSSEYGSRLHSGY